ncbi:hypothetical protein [Aeromicrobium fastidiosum]|uniref:Uncharacterized protein n=1 Tax=Aeromicrobium fastidiosum TaxID=52699 RepID=A0A641AKS5_9ACTN|nr:hypothetical protein [Aeromicrobium fastidiosum]KAA1376427.1 hypothetical protein ESP62_013445 [Aeromicrobium fastidiosum]MBP2391660.1 hypothetical protein [Aeromicrobium fastidiosum]
MTIELPGTAARHDEREHERHRSGLPALALVPLAAAVWWLAGFSWWIVDLFGSNIMTVNGYPRAALPLLAASSTDSLIVSSGVGGILAGLVVLLGRGSRLARLSAVVAGVMLAATATIVQSRAAFGDGGTGGQTTDPRVTAGLGALVVGVALVAVALGASSLAGRLGLGLALAAAAGAAPMWVYQLGSSISRTAAFNGYLDVPAEWSMAVVLIVALVAIGVRPVRHLGGWLVALSLAWLVAPTVTASGYFAMSLSRGPRSAVFVQEYLSAAGQLWRQSVQPADRPLAPWIVAIVVAGLLAWAIDRRRSEHERPEEERPDVLPRPDPPTASWP